MNNINIILLFIIVSISNVFAQRKVNDVGMNKQQTTVNTKKASTRNLTGGWLKNLDLKAYYFARFDNYDSKDRRLVKEDLQNNGLLVIENAALENNREDIDAFFKDETIVALDMEIYKRHNSAISTFNYLMQKIISLEPQKELSQIDNYLGTSYEAEYVILARDFYDRRDIILESYERPQNKDEAFEELFNEMKKFYGASKLFKRKARFYIDNNNVRDFVNVTDFEFKD